MRRSYISPEFNKINVNGTLNIKNNSSFFGTNILKIKDELTIGDVDIIWYQLPSKEQIDFSLESTLPPLYYSSSNDKKINHKIEIDSAQSNVQIESNTRWFIDIDFNNILRKYIFSEIKRSRSFNGLKNNMTRSNDVDIFINEYISENILDKYDVSDIHLFIDYKSLLLDNTLKSSINWNQSIPRSKILKNIELVRRSSDIRIYFNQIDSKKFSFDYYFNIIFKRI